MVLIIPRNPRRARRGGGRRGGGRAHRPKLRRAHGAQNDLGARRDFLGHKGMALVFDLIRVVQFVLIGVNDVHGR
jgi:hypothetical protein